MDPIADANPAAAAYARTRAPLYEPTRASRYLTMRDGTRLAIDVHLPRHLGTRVPALVRQTRYYRGYDAGWLGRVVGPSRIDPINSRMRAFFVSRGYAWIDVDVRGSGASSGVWHSPWSPLEVADGAEVLDWIVAQPWSNGRVGATGNSYDGTAAELLAANGHPALRAIAPRCSLFDVYTDVAYPGGLRQAWFTAAWTRVNQGLDAGAPERAVAEAIGQAHARWATGARRRALERALGMVFRPIRPIAGGEAWLRHAMRERAANLDVDAASHAVEFRDDPQPGALGPQTVDAFSPSAYVDRIRASGAAMLSISGWFDAAYPHAAIKRQRALGGGHLVIGPWNHGLTMNASPHAAARAVRFDLDAELLRFFDHHLLGRATGLEREARVRYYVMGATGAETWREAAAWPPPAATPHRLHLGPSTLAPTPATGRAELVHDPAATTGRRTRWRTLVSPFVVPDYPDRAAAHVYCSAPLPEALELAGHPVLTLDVALDAADGALFAYLDEEHPDGRTRYVTEGQLRLIHAPAARGDGGPTPYRSFLRADARPLTPHQLAPISFDLLPVAYRFARGARIRLALATADADHFAAVPAAARRYTISFAASVLELPCA